MKTVMALIVLCGVSLSEAESHGRHSQAFAAFHVSLSHHGEWIHYDQDLYVWRPTYVTAGWQPYTRGHWVWTVDGWYWESDEPWGWATYHYGRWIYDDYHGWVWIPDLEWGPAWVEWRTGPSCLGWAPLGPYSWVHWSVGPHWGYTTVPVRHWVFIDYKNITKHKVHNHLLASNHKQKYYEQTGKAPVGGRRTFGPDRGEVERRGKIRVTETRVNRETIENRRTSPVARVQPRSVDENTKRTPVVTGRTDDAQKASPGRTIEKPKTKEGDRGSDRAESPGRKGPERTRTSKSDSPPSQARAVPRVPNEE